MAANMRNIGYAEAKEAASETAAANGSAIDLASEVSGQFNYLKAAGPGGPELKAILTVGTAGTTMDVKFQYSADGSTGWTDITGAAFTTVTTATTEQIHFVPPARYIRVISHTQTGTFVWACVVIGEARYDL